MGAAAVKAPKPEDLAPAPPILTTSTAAWLCALPCALVVLLAIVVLGPPLGHLLHPAHAGYRFLRNFRPIVNPEPVEQGRVLIALAAPLLLSLTTIAAVRRQPRIAARLQAVGVTAAQLALVGLLAACVAGQYAAHYGFRYTLVPLTITWTYLTPATLVAGAAIAALLALAAWRADVRALAHRALRETRERRTAAALLAVAITALWLAHAVNSDRSIANEPLMLRFHLEFTLDETFAVLNGRTPLVDFSPQYGALWPFLAALPLLAFGKTLLVFTLTMCSASAAALLAVYATLRRVTRSALSALLLYLPFLATSLFKVRGTLTNRDTFGAYFGMFPLRYAGAYLLAWLTARQLDRRDAQPGAPLALFVVAGLVLLNDLDFGLAALGATLAAFLWTTVRSRAAVLRLAGAVAAGLAIAFALVSLLTLARAGSLPHLGRLTDYARMYAGGGFGMLPMHPLLGLHVAIYLTYVAAIGTATVRAAERAPNRVLTGMLAWSGVFGLGAGGYFAGRSHPEALIATFSAWALALVLLSVVALESLAAHPPRRRRPSVAALAALLGLGVAACSLAQTPTPWSQLDRLRAPLAPSAEAPTPTPLAPLPGAAARRFVSALADGRGRFVVKRGAPVAVLMTLGHRVADAYGIVDVTPYTGWHSLETVERVEATLDALRRAGGNTAIVPRGVEVQVFRLLTRRGFQVLTASGGLAPLDARRGVRHIAVVPWQEEVLTKWVDTRHLHPRALR
jgi:hypothetical protein